MVWLMTPTFLPMANLAISSGAVTTVTRPAQRFDRADNAFDFGMAAIPHQQHLIALLVQQFRPQVDLRDERTGHVQHLQPLLAGLRDDGGATPCAERTTVPS